MESFEYAPWVVLFSILVFVILYGGCILGQQIMKLPETGKDSLILFSTERTFRSLSVCWDYVLLFTRLVSFGYLLAILIYGSLSYEYAINIWYSFRMWNCLFVELFFLFSLANSVFGLFLPEKLRCCLTNSAAPGYYGYAFFMQMLFVISGATSLFIAVVMFWLQDNSTSFLNLSFNVVPMIFMIVEVRCCLLFLQLTDIMTKLFSQTHTSYPSLLRCTWTSSTCGSTTTGSTSCTCTSTSSRFGSLSRWTGSTHSRTGACFVTHMLVLVRVHCSAAQTCLLPSPRRPMSLADGTSILAYFCIILLNFFSYALWWLFSELKVALHNYMDTRQHSAFIDDSVSSFL